MFPFRLHVNVNDRPSSSIVKSGRYHGRPLRVSSKYIFILRAFFSVVKKAYLDADFSVIILNFSVIGFSLFPWKVFVW